jgi:hypothetical protein
MFPASLNPPTCSKIVYFFLLLLLPLLLLILSFPTLLCI